MHNAKVTKAAAGSLGYYDEDFNSLSTLDIQGANNTVYASGVNCVGTLYGFDTLVLTADRETNSEDAVLTLGQTETTREIQTLSNDSLFEGKTLVLRGELEGVNFLEAAEGNSYQFKNSLLRYESAFFESEVALDNFEVSNDQGLDSSRDIVTELKQNLSLTRASATLSQSRLAEIAFVTQGAEFIADTAIPEAAQAVEASDFTGFAAISGTNTHYETGSYVDINGFSFAGGVASRIGDTVLAGFLEYGRANSDQYAGTGRGESEHDYVGVGIAAQKTFGQVSIDSTIKRRKPSILIER